MLIKIAQITSEWTSFPFLYTENTIKLLYNLKLHLKID